LNTVFRRLLDVAGGQGGDCLKFGGDALLLLFTGPAHERRGAAAARGMLLALQTLRRHGEGAGLSKTYARPNWQDGVKKITGSKMRSFPYISMEGVNGTSQSAPWAADSYPTWQRVAP
jgi:hypothetical protein